MWVAVLLALVVVVGTAYWFGVLTPSPLPGTSEEKARSSKPTREPEPPKPGTKSKPDKKRNPKKTAPKQEKRKLPTDPRFLRRYGGHSDCILSMAISPNGEWLATAGKDGQVRVAHQGSSNNHRFLNAMLQREQGLFQDHLSAVAWSGDGRTVIGATAHGRNLCFFRIRKKEGGSDEYELHEQVKRRFSTTSKVDDTIDMCLVDHAHSNFSLVITNVAGGDRGNTVAWNGKTGDSVGVLSTGNGKVRMSPDGRFLCGQGVGVAQVKIYEVLRKKVKGEVEPMFDSLSPKGVMTLVPPNKVKIDDIAFCSGDKSVVCCDDGSVQIWSLHVEYWQREDPKLLCTSNVLKGKKITHLATSFLEDMNRIAVVTDDDKLHVLTWDSASSISLDFTIDFVHSEGVADLQFCPATGKVLYSRGAYPSKDVFAWNVA